MRTITSSAITQQNTPIFDQPMTVYLTPAQKEAIMLLCEKYKITYSELVRNMTEQTIEDHWWAEEIIAMRISLSQNALIPVKLLKSRKIKIVSIRMNSDEMDEYNKFCESRWASANVVSEVEENIEA